MKKGTLAQMRRHAGLPAVAVSAARLRRENPKLAADFARFIEEHRALIVEVVSQRLESK